jgi:transposase
MTIYLGIDWSEAKHDLAFVNSAGVQVAKATIAHDQKGFQRLTELCAQLQVTPDRCPVAIETKHNLLVDYLWSYGYSQVYVIPPSLVKGYRKRYSPSGARTDASDAYMLADIVRTDRGRLTLWQPDQPLTCQLRVTITQVHQLTRQGLAMAQQLRAMLLRYYPGLLEVFPNLQTQSALTFLQHYPTPAAAARVTVDEFQAFLRQHHNAHHRQLLPRLSALQQPPIATAPGTADLYAAAAQRLAGVLLALLQAKGAAQREVTALFKQHPDHDIFASLPGTGDFLAPALLAKFGDDRQRFPSAAAVQALAGTCPVTEQSGKHRSVHFRHACDHDLRTFAQQWAIASVVRTQSPFACAYFDSLRQRNMAQNHAYRCLANRWLAIAWHLWYTHTFYDQAFHLTQRAQRSQPLATTRP